MKKFLFEKPAKFKCNPTLNLPRLSMDEHGFLCDESEYVPIHEFEEIELSEETIDEIKEIKKKVGEKKFNALMSII